MTDEFLSRFKEEPRAELATGLKERLDEIDGEEPAAPSWPLRPVLAATLAAAALAVALTVPTVRAAAREFLDFFRVQRFAAVPVDTERLERLHEGGVDIKTLVGEQIQILEEGAEPEAVESVALASSLAGVEVRQPTTLPEKATFAGLTVAYPGAFRLTLNVAKLREAAALLGVEDPHVPSAWDGAAVDVDLPPTVVARYERGDAEFVLIQSSGPEVALPESVALEELGALGLRMAGMSAQEARLFSARIDWRSTFLVPIPAEGSHFREVQVGGHRGLLVSGRSRPKPDSDGTPRRGPWKAALFWADGDRVYAATGPGHGMEVLQMAESIE